MAFPKNSQKSRLRGFCKNLEKILQKKLFWNKNFWKIWINFEEVSETCLGLRKHTK